MLSDLFSFQLYNVKKTISKLLYKLTRNKNARHIFPRHFLTVAMIGIKYLYMRIVLFIFHTQSLFFKYLHYSRPYDNHCKKCTCTSCAATTRLFDAMGRFELWLRFCCDSVQFYQSICLFVSYLVGNHVDRFSCDMAYITRYQDSERAINIISCKHPSLKVKPDNCWTFQVY